MDATQGEPQARDDGTLFEAASVALEERLLARCQPSGLTVGPVVAPGTYRPANAAPSDDCAQKVDPASLVETGASGIGNLISLALWKVAAAAADLSKEAADMNGAPSSYRLSLFL